ncbi:MAG: pyruvate flavodoxin/ferredoxin oxidoreductase [Thermodesulfobacteriota bacterium]
MGQCFIEGNEAAAWGAFYAGCRFFAGYPITPATSIYSTMLGLLPPAGGVVLQGEDEMASMGYCLGASMAGLKAMTATSGPGLSLYSEHISFAIGSEIPLVIVDVQRLGPSTGSATKGADGDVMFLRWGSSGGLPVIVLAPVDVGDCFTLTMHAFNLAERFRGPVFIASNKEIGLTRESVDLGALERPAPVYRAGPTEGRPYLPFAPDPATGVPYFLPLGHEVLARQTSSTHGVDGYITTDPDEIQSFQDRLAHKILAARDEFCFYEYLEAPGARTLVTAYGVTARAAKTAFQAAADLGRPFSLLVLKTLWPAPEKVLRAKAAAADRVLVVEMNQGQFLFEVERIVRDKRIEFFGQMNGKLITPEQILEAAK